MKQGMWFPFELENNIKERFWYPDADPTLGKRLFFDNAGGSLRLKTCVEAKAEYEYFPDCPERTHRRGVMLKEVVNRGTKEILEIVFGAKEGALITELTASQTMFHMVELVMENIPGANAVVSCLEHPSAFDAVDYFCRKTGKELRVVPANPKTGQIEPETVAEFVDENTCLVSIMAASNVTGAIMDIEKIVKLVRNKKPDLYVICDGVQHAPHGKMDVSASGVDGMNFAPYKCFGVRGCGFAYVSERLAKLPHRKLIKKDETVFELGTPSPGNFAATMEMINYVCEIGSYSKKEADKKEQFREGMNRIHLKEQALLHRLLEGTEDIPGLRHIPGVTVFADGLELSDRDLIVAMGIDGLEPQDAVKAYEAKGVIVCDRLITSMYAKRSMEALNISGCLRISPMHCHGKEDIDAFLKVTQDIAKDRA